MPSIDSSTSKFELVVEFDFTTKVRSFGVPVKKTVLLSPLVSNLAPLLPEQAKVLVYESSGLSVHPIGDEFQTVLLIGKVVCPKEEIIRHIEAIKLREYFLIILEKGYL